MFTQKKQSIEDRIVSLTQPHIRPIVRGKAGTPVEFGAKLSANCMNEYVFLFPVSWDNFNESGDLKNQIEDERVRNTIEGKFGQAKRRFGLNRVIWGRFSLFLIKKNYSFPEIG